MTPATLVLALLAPFAQLDAGAPRGAPPAQALPSVQPAVQPPVQLPPRGSAADSVLEARTTAVAAQLRCVVCQGLSIQDSPSELAQQMRGLVREQLAAGKSEREVRDYFIARYGEWILLSPRPTGFNLLVYLLPGLALVGGGVMIVMVARRWISAPAAPDGDATPVAAEDEASR
jgi:cytochrome c-type biogenesis protein CcmH